MESIKSGEIKKSGGIEIPASVEAPQSAPATKTTAKPAAIADSTVRSTSAPQFAPRTAKTTGSESSAVGHGLTALAEEGTQTKVAANNVIVWARENNFTSQGQTRSVSLADVTVSNTGVRAPFVHVTGKTVLTSIEGIQPFEGNSKVTTDGFDQANLVAALVDLNRRQAAVGIDNTKLWAAARNNGVIRAKANGVSDLNAFYSPTANDLTFGTNNDKWHLASDNDVTLHEAGHSRGDKQNPDMFSGEGGAIHEGWFGDFSDALIARNANLSEDFGSALGKPGQPLRNLNNDKTLRQAGDEVHDRGEAYGGLGWRVTEALATKVGGLERACSVMEHVALKSGYYFTSKSPSSKDFIDAIAKCVRDSLPKVVDEATVNFVIDALKQQGIKREMITADWKEPAKVNPDAKTAKVNEALAGKASSCSVDEATSAIYSAFGKRADCEVISVQDLAWKNPASGLPSQKLILQLQAVDSARGKKYPVRDGFMSLLASGDQVTDFAGSGRRILDQGEAYKFDFTPIKDYDATLAKARAAIDKFVSSELESHKHLKNALKSNMAHFFTADGLQVDEVMYNKKICLQITTEAGQFIYDEAQDKVAASRLMFVDVFPETRTKKS